MIINYGKTIFLLHFIIMLVVITLCVRYYYHFGITLWKNIKKLASIYLVTTMTVNISKYTLIIPISK